MALVYVFNTSFYVLGENEDDARAELTKLLWAEIERDDLADSFDLVETFEEEE